MVEAFLPVLHSAPPRRISLRRFSAFCSHRVVRFSRTRHGSDARGLQAKGSDGDPRCRRQGAPSIWRRPDRGANSGYLTIRRCGEMKDLVRKVQDCGGPLPMLHRGNVASAAATPDQERLQCDDQKLFAK